MILKVAKKKEGQAKLLTITFFFKVIHVENYFENTKINSMFKHYTY